MIYDRRLIRTYGRTAAMVAWLNAHPGAVCVVPNQARKKLLQDRYGVSADRVLVVDNGSSVFYGSVGVDDDTRVSTVVRKPEAATPRSRVRTGTLPSVKKGRAAD